MFLMVSYSAACSASVMARRDESHFNLPSVVASRRAELQAQGAGTDASRGSGCCSSADTHFALEPDVWTFRNLQIMKVTKGF